VIFLFLKKTNFSWEWEETRTTLGWHCGWWNW